MAEAMAKATAKEHMLLATMAGQSSIDDAVAVPVGAALENLGQGAPIAASRRLRWSRSTPASSSA